MDGAGIGDATVGEAEGTGPGPGPGGGEEGDAPAEEEDVTITYPYELPLRFPWMGEDLHEATLFVQVSRARTHFDTSLCVLYKASGLVCRVIC